MRCKKDKKSTLTRLPMTRITFLIANSEKTGEAGAMLHVKKHRDITCTLQIYKKDIHDA
jgi:hypothetical protein